METSLFRVYKTFLNALKCEFFPIQFSTNFSLVSNHFDVVGSHWVKNGVILVHIFPAFSRIWTEYGEIRSISPYSVRMRQNVWKMGTRITPNTDTFYAVSLVKVFPIFSLNSLQNTLRLVSAFLNTLSTTLFNKIYFFVLMVKANVAFKTSFSSWFQNFTTRLYSMYQFFSIYTGHTYILFVGCKWI